MSVHPAHRVGSTSEPPGARTVLRPVPGMKPGQLVACSVSLVVAGLLLTRGFIGFNPGRPLFVVLGVVLALSATAGLAIDHVAIRPTSERPADVFLDELNRSRRYGHALSLVTIDCDPDAADLAIASMRGSDRAWRDRHGIHVLLPETDRDGVHGFVARLDGLVGPDAVRAAVFPDDGLTVEGLADALAPLEPRGPRLAAAPAPDPPDLAVGGG